MLSESTAEFDELLEGSPDNEEELQLPEEGVPLLQHQLHRPDVLAVPLPQQMRDSSIAPGAATDVTDKGAAADTAIAAAEAGHPLTPAAEQTCWDCWSHVRATRLYRGKPICDRALGWTGYWWCPGNVLEFLLWDVRVLLLGPSFTLVDMVAAFVRWLSCLFRQRRSHIQVDINGDDAIDAVVGHVLQAAHQVPELGGRPLGHLLWIVGGLVAYVLLVSHFLSGGYSSFSVTLAFGLPPLVTVLVPGVLAHIVWVFDDPDVRAAKVKRLCNLVPPSLRLL